MVNLPKAIKHASATIPPMAKEAKPPECGWTQPLLPIDKLPDGPLARRGALDITGFGRVSQGEALVLPGRNELLSDVTFVTCLQDRPHYGWVIDFLGVVQFRSTRVSCSVVMPDNILVLPDAPNDVSVHDLDVIDVKEQFEARGANLIDHFGAMINVVAKVSRMALHWMGIISGVEVFQAKSDFFLLGQRKDSFPAFQAVFLRLVLIHVFFFHTRKGNHSFVTGL